MEAEKLIDRIILDPKVKKGKPVIRGTRLSVDFILNLLAHGSTESDILEEYNGLTLEDIRACFLFATNSLNAPVLSTSKDADLAEVDCLL